MRPGSVAAGPQNAEVSGCVEPLGERRAVDDGGGRVAGDVGAAIPALSGPLRGGRAWKACSTGGLGKPSARRVPEGERQRMLELYRELYGGWNVKHFHEHLRARSQLRLGLHLDEDAAACGRAWSIGPGGAGRIGASGRAQAVRGDDAAPGRQPHAWLEGQPTLDLIVTMDDATSTIYSAFLVEEEGTASSFRGLLETFVAKGLPSSLYTDRGSHYFYTPKAGEGVDKERLTQVGRALDQARHRAHPGLFAGGAGPLGADVRHAAGPAAEGAEAGRDRRRRGGQPLHRRDLSAGPQRSLRQAAGGRARAPSWPPIPAAGRDPVHGGRARRGARQHGWL